MDSPQLRPPTDPMQQRPPKLLDQVRERIRTLHYSIRTEDAYADWVRRYILFHGEKHPQDMGAPEVEAFLTFLAVERKVSASTQNQAKAAILFLYKEVLKVELPWLSEITVARVSRRLPVVLTPREVRLLLDELRATETMWLIVSLLYGTGMRVLEGLRLRVKDLEFERREIVVRQGKGDTDRVTMLPENLIVPLKAQLARAVAWHQKDLAAGFGAVSLPDALEVKYSGAAKSWPWQYVFPSPVRSLDPRTGLERRHHIHEQTIQKAVSIAAKRAHIEKPCSPQVLRHSFATHLLQASYDIRTVQELLGHKSVTTTQIYTQVLNKGGRAVTSPLDTL